jgi:methylthioribose-1-phosphate isomerase
MVETMRWTRGRLDLLDQTLLPEKVIYRPLRTVREVTDAISKMLVRGAPAIGVTAAFGMALAARNAVGSAPPLTASWSRASGCSPARGRPRSTSSGRSRGCGGSSRQPPPAPRNRRVA